MEAKKIIISLEKTSYQKDSSRFDGWGYKVSYKTEFDTGSGTVIYENRAINLDGALLLEERFETTPKDFYFPFGIEKDAENTVAANKRIYNKAKKNAEGLLEKITPEIKDLTQQ